MNSNKHIVDIDFKNDNVKIAVIDGHKLFREGLIYIIKAEGYHVHLSCDNGNEFITKLQVDNLPDIGMKLLQFHAPIYLKFLASGKSSSWAFMRT